MDQVCPSCQFAILSQWYFCPNCGKVLKERPIVISIPKQILIYLVSFFLAPLGLGWGLKYIKSKDTKVKIVGIIAILLTVISIIILFITFKSFMDQYGKTLDSLTTGRGY